MCAENIPEYDSNRYKKGRQDLTMHCHLSKIDRNQFEKHTHEKHSMISKKGNSPSTLPRQEKTNKQTNKEPDNSNSNKYFEKNWYGSQT